MDLASVSFSGINSALGAEFTLSCGASPSVCTLWMVPQTTLDLPPGVLQFSQGGTAITFYDCAIDMAYVRKWADNTSWRWSVQILDRRWRWRYRQVSGRYNVRLFDGTIPSSNRASAQQLAAIILLALGESNFDVSQVPQNVYPYADWLGKAAADALQELCDYVGCVIVLGTDNRITIYRSGNGVDAPDNSSVRHPRFNVRLRRVPQRIIVVGSPDIYQSKFLTELITREADGEHRLFDDSSYLPDDMENESPWSFPSVSDDDDRAAAFQSAYRWHRAKQLVQGGMIPQGCPVAVNSMEQMLPFLGKTLEWFVDRENVGRNGRPYLEGNFWGYGDTPENVTNQRYTGEFKVYNDWGVVETAKPVLYLDSSYQFSDPSLYLTAAFNVRAADGSYVRLVRQGFAGGVGDLVLVRPELFQTFQTVYDDATVTGLVTNQTAVLAEADAYIGLFQQKFADPWSYEREYTGIQAISPNGKIQQVKWSCHVHRDPLTHIGVNEEFDVYNSSAKQRRAYATA